MAGVLAKSSVAPDRSMAYRGTAVFIAYNSDKVPVPPKTEKELHAWIKANPGRFAYNDPGTGGSGNSFVITTVYNLMPPEALTSPDEKWMAQWDAGFAVLKDLHPYLYKASGKVQYTVKNQGSLDLLASGAIWMCPAWADMTLDQKSRGLLPASIKLQQIDPPLTGNITQAVIPVMSKNAEAAYKFLNFVASVEAQDILVNVMKAIPVIDTNKLPKATVDLLSGLEIRFRSYTIGGLNTKLQERWSKEIATLP
jgi:putative spermidine/putrescine transport system substrate-binding protein